MKSNIPSTKPFWSFEFSILKLFVIWNLWFVILATLWFVIFGLNEAEAALIGKPPTNLGLVGYWAMNEGTGAYAGDASGNKNTGTLTGGPTFVDGKRGKALNFDGVNDYVSIPSASGLDFADNKVTMAAWVKPNSLAGTGAPRVFNHNGTDDYLLAVSQTSIASPTAGNSVYTAFGTAEADGGVNAISAGVWNHIVSVYNGTSFAIYVNGVAVTTSNPAAAGYGDTQTTIGARITTGSPGVVFPGLIDEVRVYNRVLGASEITALYNSGAAKFAAAPTNLGLVGYWSMNEGTGAYAGDSSGNKNTGTLTSGPTWVDGKRGKALNFDGVDDYVDAGDSVSLRFGTGDFSISTWIWHNGIAQTNAAILGKRNGVGPYNQYAIFMNDGNVYISGSGTKIAAFIRPDGGGQGSGDRVVYSGSLLAGWHHVVMVDDYDTELRLYIDGVSVGVDTASHQDKTNNHIGQTFQINRANTATLFRGLIDEVRVYNRALSAAEIQTLYNSTYAKVNAPQNNQITNGLVGLWSFNGQDMSGNTAYDRSGQGNNGTLTNGPALAPGKIGQALNFDGVDDYVGAGSGSSIDNIFDTDGGGGTLSAWIKPRSVGEGAARGGIVATKSSWSFEMRANNQIRFHYLCTDLGGGAINAWASSNNTISYNAWQHVVVVYNNSSVANQPTIYINGTPASLTQIFFADDSPCESDAGFNLNIGNDSNGDFTFDGTIDEVRMYDRVLTPAEIKRLYNMGR